MTDKNWQDEPEILRELYHQGANGAQLRSVEIRNVELDTGGTLAYKLTALQDQLSQIRLLFERSPRSDADREDYKRDVQLHESAIAHLKKVAERSIIESLIEERHLALGYSSPSDPCPQVIPPSRWPFLTLDIENSTAQGDGVEYRALRFVRWRGLDAVTVNGLRRAMVKQFGRVLWDDRQSTGDKASTPGADVEVTPDADAEQSETGAEGDCVRPVAYPYERLQAELHAIADEMRSSRRKVEFRQRAGDLVIAAAAVRMRSFNPQDVPGTFEDIRWLLGKMAPEIVERIKQEGVLKENFQDLRYRKEAVCKCRGDGAGKKFWREVFPEIP